MERISVKPHAGQLVGRAQTLLPHLLHRYPPLVGCEWHAHRVGPISVIRDGNPIIRRALLLVSSSAAVRLSVEVEEEGVAGGVVARISSSR